MLYLNHSLKIDGFDASEVLHIEAPTLLEASRILGHKNKTITREILKKNLVGSGKKKYLQKCLKELNILENLSKKGYFKVNGINYAKRYLDAIKGFAQGSEITIAEAIFLQKEIQPGCQTMIAKNENGGFSFLHTEENSPDDNTLPAYNYRVVKMKIPGKEVVFFAFPGICGWGPAFGIDRTNMFAQLVDDIYIAEKFSGSLWSNMIAFMVFDTGSVKKADLLFKKIAIAGRRHGFSCGYAVHTVQYKDKADSVSYEFGGKLVRKANTFSNIYAQVNYSNNDELKKMADFYPPRNLKNWDKDRQMEYLEVTRREARLMDLGKMGLWKTNSADATIKTGLKVLAYPHGDLRKYKGKDGKMVYYHTGLPSRWTFAHFVGYLGKHSKFYIGKKTPAPIKGMEYSNDIGENYKYAEEKLWKL
jgi:hypothetical protein